MLRVGRPVLPVELELDRHLSGGSGLPQTMQGCPDPGPPNMWLGRRDGTLPFRSASRACSLEEPHRAFRSSPGGSRGALPGRLTNRALKFNAGARKRLVGSRFHDYPPELSEKGVDVLCPPFLCSTINWDRDSRPTSFATSSIKDHVNISVTGETLLQRLVPSRFRRCNPRCLV